jgi:outer membrane protein assembly factor BamA
MCAIKKVVAVAAVLVALLAIVPCPADAQGLTTVRPGGRGGTWDFYLPFMYADTTTINGQNGSSVKINGDYGMGFGFGYNLSENFQLGGIFNWNSRSYEAKRVEANTGTIQQYNGYADTTSLTLNGIFYFLQGNITPFVSGNVGITYVDTNIPTGTGSTSCWYDPWWGYVCSTYVPTKTENDVTYGFGVGVRADLNRQFALQFSYNKNWIDISKANGTPDFDTWRLDLLFRM